MDPLSRELYRQEFLYWLKKGILVPVVKGGYPHDHHIAPERWKRDGPSDDFLRQLRELRASHEDRWIVVARDATERGRDRARDLIGRLGGDSKLSRSLRVEVDVARVPELAYYLAGGSAAQAGDMLLETVGAYENDDWIRSEYSLGEYLLPSPMAAQYRVLHDLSRGGTHPSDVASSSVALAAELTTNSVYALALGVFLEKRGITGWPERARIEEWREMGLHNVLRDFLASEAALLHVGSGARRAWKGAG